MKYVFHLSMGVLLGFLLLNDLAAATTPLISQGDSWRYRRGTNAPQSDWKTVSDAGLNASWQTGNGGFGFATDNAGETVNCQTILTNMQNQHTTFYIRREFTINGPVDPAARLILRMDWDDGYIAWLDGVFLTNANYTAAPTEPAFNAPASSSHESSAGNGTPSPVVNNDLGLAAPRLAPGTHTLAIIGLNASSGSTDFILVPNLLLDVVVVVPPTNAISGLIATNTTLHASNGIYTATGDITVAAGATLTIEPGVRVQFNAGTGMTVNGRLLANGTAASPIRFTRATAGTRWKRIHFSQASPSVFRHCVVEFSDCPGDHKDYYDNDCNTATPPLPGRNYFQAIVAVATHLDIEHCLFQNLPDDGANGEGDAIAIISDDVDKPGEASANIRFCNFIDIGQGIHTRYSYVLVEGCYATSHNGDNDDVDIYGESLPPSLVINNRFVNSADDFINPTRSSAILIGNTFGGTTDSGVVLRDRGCPVMINNVVYDCPSAGIDVQNRNDAILLHNTIVNCGTGIYFRDHTARYTPPYCLFPGSGRATVVNCAIWDCTRAFNLTESPEAAPFDSFASVMHCNVEGGQGAATVSAGSTLIWGPGNINSDPLFVNLGAKDFHLTAGSPCIDAGTNFSATFTITNRLGVVATVTVSVTNDLGGIGRPLDGNGDGLARPDIGAFEYLLPTADSNGDGVPDGWYAGYGLNPADPNIGSGNADGDPHNNRQEYVADTNPTNALSHLRIVSNSAGVPATVQFPSSTNRLYTLQCATNLAGTVTWTDVSGQMNMPGNGGQKTLSDGSAAPRKFYRVSVRVP